MNSTGGMQDTEEDHSNVIMIGGKEIAVGNSLKAKKALPPGTTRETYAGYEEVRCVFSVTLCFPIKTYAHHVEVLLAASFLQFPGSVCGSACCCSARKRRLVWQCLLLQRTKTPACTRVTTKPRHLNRLGQLSTVRFYTAQL